MISEKQYLELCDACNRLLLLPESTLEMVAIPWLHVIREHPIVLEKYVSLFYPKSIIENIKARFFNKLVWFRQVFRALRSNGEPWFGADMLPDNLDVLFISHLLNPSQYGEKDDFYFDSIPELLRVKGRTVAIASICHFRGHKAYFKTNFKPTKIPRVFLSETLNFKREFNYRVRLRKEAKRLRSLQKSKQIGLEMKILSEASNKVLDGTAQNNLRLYDQITSLVAITNAKIIITPYEGHAHERIVFSAARQINKNIRCLSYQHTGVFRLSNAIRNSLSRIYNPDLIITSGLSGKSDLEKSEGLRTIPVSVIGSSRGISLELNYSEKAQNRNRVLVLPEGFLSECEILFEFSISCAVKMPDFEFVWRLHPSVSFKILSEKIDRFRELPKNIILSDMTFEEDINRCQWSLYRGTTAIFKAISSGLRPIYLKSTETMTIDPLYEMDTWRVVVEDVEEFKSLVDNNFGIDDNEVKRNVSLSRMFCKQRFSAFNIDPIEAILVNMDNKNLTL